MTQLSKALLSLTQDGQKGIPPCYGEKSLCCLRAKDKRRSMFLHFTCDKIVLNFRSYLDIVGNSSCYQIAEKRQYANWSQNSKWLFFRWPKGSWLVWEWPQRAIAFSKGFMRRQRTDKSVVWYYFNWFLIQGLNVLRKNLLWKVFDADMFHDFFVLRCLSLLACLQSISLLTFSVMEILKVIFLFFFIWLNVSGWSFISQ